MSNPCIRAPTRSIPKSPSPPSTARCACSKKRAYLDRHDFGDGRARYEAAPEAHHDHLIDVESGKVVEFVDPELEALQKQIAHKLGYRLVDHRMELYAVKLDRPQDAKPGGDAEPAPQ